MVNFMYFLLDLFPKSATFCVVGGVEGVGGGSGGIPLLRGFGGILFVPIL